MPADLHTVFSQIGRKYQIFCHCVETFVLSQYLFPKLFHSFIKNIVRLFFCIHSRAYFYGYGLLFFSKTTHDQLLLLLCSSVALPLHQAA